MDLKALQNLAEQLQWLVETIKERFSQLVTACTESLITIADMFQEVKKKNRSRRWFSKSIWKIAIQSVSS